MQNHGSQSAQLTMTRQSSDSSREKNSDLQTDELFEMTLEVIIRMYIDFGQEQPSDEVREIMAASWTDHLRKQGVPVHAVPLLYDEAVKIKVNKGNAFMPVITEILACWATLIDQGYYENPNKEELEHLSLPGPAFNPDLPEFRIFKMSRKRWAAGKDTVCCDCVSKSGKGVIAKLTPDFEWLCCQSGYCDFRWPASRFMEARVHPKWVPDGDVKSVSAEEVINANP